VRLTRLPSTSFAAPTWPPLIASRGLGAESSPHAHHAMHFIIAVAGELEIRATGAPVRAPGVLTGPDVRHAIGAAGLDVLLVFIDPESDAGGALAAALGEPVRLLDDAARAALAGADPAALMASGGEPWIREAVARLGATDLAPRTPVHPGVRRVLRHLRGLPADGDASLEALARIADLSPGRLMHAFTESIGIPLRPYLAWLRLQRAAGGIVRGEPLSGAAAAAGFSDAAHMSRTFRRMLGMAPSMLQPARSQPVRS
jgi:transcriptional regulator GlxA family with amidase domain